MFLHYVLTYLHAFWLLNICILFLINCYSKHLKHLVCNITVIYFSILDSTPDIIEGPFEEPSIVTDGHKSVKTGTPVYVVVGNDVIIKCNVHSGIHPITISWLRNGRSYGRENDSSIIIHDAGDGDVFSCIAENCKGSDNESTTINVYGKWVAICNVLKSFKPGMHQPVAGTPLVSWNCCGLQHRYMCVCMCMYVCACVCVCMCACVCVCPHQD